MVTCGTDRTLFFFTINDETLVPMTYTLLPCSATSAVWTSQGVIVGCEDGTLLCVIPPQSHDHVAAATYEFKPEIAQHKFVLPQSLWPPPPKKEAAADDDGKANEEGVYPPPCVHAPWLLPQYSVCHVFRSVNCSKRTVHRLPVS